MSTLTPAADRAIQAARRIACAEGSDLVTPAHVLGGLLEEDEGRPAVLLTRFGVEISAIPLAPGASQLTTSRTFDELVDSAGALAARISGDRTIGTEHLLLTILQTERVVRELLEELGLDFTQLQSAIVGDADAALPVDEPLQLPDQTNEMDFARIMDVGANRVREALRVIEDYCRFVLDDAFLCRRCKEMRHEFSEVIRPFSNDKLRARDTVHDVGTAITADGEGYRASVQSVLSANFKRLQESLRSLEEFGKLGNEHFAATFERLRYESYTLERAVLLGTSARQRLADARLYVLLSSQECQAALDWTIQEAAAGGAQIIQLREKALNDLELLEKARRVRQWTRKAGVLFIINDRPDIGRLAEADGVHLGQEDLPVKEARRIIGPHALIGVSTHNLEQVRRAVLDGADYVGVGPIFPSQTKEFPQVAGLEFLRVAAKETTLPAFAIGGIGADNIAEVLYAGIHRIAVGGAISKADDPRCVAKELRTVLEGG